MKKIDKIKTLIQIDSKLVSDLYAVTNKTMVIVFVLSTLISYFLLPILGNIVYIWGLLFSGLIIYRLMLFYKFKYNFNQYTVLQWYTRFLISSMLTALFFSLSSFSIVIVPNDTLLHLLITILLVGYASASHSALLSDVRISILYTLILIIPLSLILIFSNSQLLHLLSIFVILHLIALIVIQIQQYQQQKKLLTITQKLEYASSHDELTKLLNRRGFIEKMNKSLEKIYMNNHYAILLYLDLNQFKVINDSLGHYIGDKVLHEVGLKLKSLSFSNSIISRYGGDEFIIYLPTTTQDKSILIQEAKGYAERVDHLFAKPFIIEDNALHIQASIGVIVIEPHKKNTIKDILGHADLTMYRAKKSKKNISFYDVSLDKEQKELYKLQHDFSYAIENNELKLYFQPIVDIRHNTLSSAELLIRWQHPAKGILKPESFLPLVIKAGLLSKMTWWIIDQTCQQIVNWQKNGLWKLSYISINIDAQELMEQHFIAQFKNTLSYYDIDPSCIVLEITEQSLIDNFKHTQKVISDLKTYGVVCAIDDFGVGYSSLSYLQKLSCGILKIDKAFVEYIHINKKELSLLSTIINIGKEFGYTIIVEGIEKEEQKNDLKAVNEDFYYQGYFYSEPVDVEEFTNRFLNNI